MAITTTTTYISLSTPHCLTKPLNPKPISSLRLRPTKPSLSFASATTTKLSPFTRTTISIHHPLDKRPTQTRRIYADATPTEADTAQQIVSAGDDGVSTIISALLFVAFVGLSILTIGVIYIGVSDFLQKREKEKFEKEEEEAGKKKGGKKKKSRARGGPRGFGQKLDDQNDLD